MAELQKTYNSMPARYPELRGQVAVVTGSSRGIGAGIAARLAREGMRVVVHGLDADETTHTTAALHACGADVRAVIGDVRDAAVIDGLFDAAAHYGRLDLWVNNAALLQRFHSDALTAAELDAQLDVNVRVPTLCAVRAAHLMRSQGSGNIINISSVGGLRAQFPGLPYGLTKGALDALTRGLAIDLGDAGIRVNAVAPGWTPHSVTPETDGDYLREVSAYVPLRTWGTAADIGAMVAFLASPDARYITGQTFYVDGGLTAQLHPPTLAI
jgi:NAD(P)-dependent dehydrogenase (short-subunit alcohol dehydrogenase family)